MTQGNLFRCFTMAMAGLLLSAPANGGDWPAATLSPTGKWTVDYGDDHCSLSRDFGPPGDPLRFSFQPSIAGMGAKIIFVASALKDAPRHSRIRITLMPSGAGYTFDPSTDPSDQATGSAFFTTDRGFRPGFAEATAMMIAFKARSPIMLEFGPAGQAAASLKTCEDDLVRHFGIDPATLVSVDDPGRFVSPDSYPIEAIRSATSGRVIAAVAIGRNGRPTGCKAVVSSGSALLDTATCTVFAKNLRIDAISTGPETRWAIIPMRWVLPGRKR